MRRLDAASTGGGIGARVADYRARRLISCFVLALVDNLLEEKAAEGKYA
jgi:hypothetical protein